MGRHNKACREICGGGKVMANYITVDGGTTNTRLTLVLNGKCVDTVRYNVGARAGIDDGSLLKNAVKEGIMTLVERNKLNVGDIQRILASGMITSEFGLCKLDHLTVPAGIKELHGAMHEVVLLDISPIPFVFMRGVKTDAASLENTDMMRGEETELLGLSDNLSGVYILPGSHSKIINVDSDGRIVDFKTMLTGEMLYSLSEYTILKSSVQLSGSDIDEEYLLKGYDYCNGHGINEALFKTRVLGNLFSTEKSQVYSFFMGVVLCQEVNSVIDLGPEKITVGGKKQIKEATVILLKKLTDSDIVSVPDETVDISSSMGMVRIFEYK